MMHSATKRIIVSFCILSLITLLSIYINMNRFLYDFSEATYRSLFFLLEDTIWSHGFSEDRFSKLRIGMNEQQVRSLLGEPLRKTCGENSCEWVYSWQKTGNSSFDRRDVIFNVDGHVVRIRHEFYID